MLPAAAGYDRAITVFSPDGRLYQVEYAIETVRRGTLAVGIKSKDGIVLAVEERTRKLQVANIPQKIFQVDTHIGVAAAGYIPDARMLIDQARVLAQTNRLVYDEPIDVEGVAKGVADMAQQFTQYAGVRPFGVSLIIGGVDSDPKIFLTDPSGTYIGYNAVAIGSGHEQVTEFIEKTYNENITLEEACILAIKSIYLISEEKIESRHIKVATIDVTTKRMRMLNEEEISKYAEKSRRQ